MKLTFDSESTLVFGMLAVLFAVLVGGCSYKNTPHMQPPVHCDVTDMDGMCWESPREYAQGWENE